MIFQHFNLAFLQNRGREWAFRSKSRVENDAEIRARVVEMLELVGLADQGDKYPAQLSGG